VRVGPFPLELGLCWILLLLDIIINLRRAVDTDGAALDALLVLDDGPVDLQLAHGRAVAQHGPYVQEAGAAVLGVVLGAGHVLDDVLGQDRLVRREQAAAGGVGALAGDHGDLGAVSSFRGLAAGEALVRGTIGNKVTDLNVEEKGDGHEEESGDAENEDGDSLDKYQVSRDVYRQYVVVNVVEGPDLLVHQVHELVKRRAKHGSNCDKNGDHEGNEVNVVVHSDAVVDPRAMVVESLNAAIARATMPASRRSNDQTIWAKLDRVHHLH